MVPAGGWKIHRPVLLEETVSMLQVKAGGTYMDGTLGLGGHTGEILERSSPNGRVIGFEWDETAIEKSKAQLAKYHKRLTVIRRNFAEINEGLSEAGLLQVDGIVIDIGVSSLQLDSRQRGFSFKRDEQLDMRMDQRREKTAQTILETASERELADIFYYYGEEIQSRRIARHLVQERDRKKIETTGQLADLVSRSIPRKYHPPKIHVATKVFQALRIAVNDELSNLALFLDRVADCLTVGGRLCIISFHSLEDRIVKKKTTQNNRLSVVTKKPIVPSTSEIKENPRSRSARLRVSERLA